MESSDKKMGTSTDPIVTVVTICLNMAREIASTVCSVLRQKEAYFEYIIKDGNSSDGTNEIINEMIRQEKSLKIKHIVSSDTGIYDAMNQAVGYATGKWILFINGGDFLFDEYVIRDFIYKEQMIEEQIVFGNTLYAMSPKNWFIKLHSDCKLNLLFDIGHESTFVKRDLFEQFRFDNTYKVAGDYDLLRRLWEAGLRFRYINQTVSVCDRKGVSNGMRRDVFYEKLRAQGKTNTKNCTMNYYMWKTKKIVGRLFPKMENIFFIKNSVGRTKRNYEFNYRTEEQEK